MTGYQEWGAEQRRSPGFRTRLNGRYLLADGRESRCTLTDVSVGGVAVVAPDKGAIGESVVIYVDHIGRIEGKIVRHLENGFAVAFDVAPRSSDPIATHIPGAEAMAMMSQVASEPRREPHIRLSGEFARQSTGDDGRQYQVLDLSFTGAEIGIAGERPPVGVTVRIGKFNGRVVRHTAAGVAVVFTEAAPPSVKDRASDAA